MKKALIVIAVVLVFVIGAGALAFRSMAAAAQKRKNADKGAVQVSRSDISVKVVETGKIEATKTVEVKSRVAGRVAKLLVDEGDLVQQGQLIAVIDPQETQLQVEQNMAQLKGAQSAVTRQQLEIEQRRKTAAADLRDAQVRVAQLKAEMNAQPALTQAAIAEAQTALTTAIKERERLQQSEHPNQRTAAETALREAQANFAQAQSEYNRQNDLFAKEYVAKRAVEDAKLQLDLAQARLDQAKQNLSRLNSTFAVDMAKANESVKQAEASLRRAKVNSIQDKIKAQDYQAALVAEDKARAALMDIPVMQQSKAQSEASVAQLNSVLRDAQRQLGETEIRAPISGVVTKKSIQEGELVASLSSFSSGTPIVTIEDRRSMRVNLNINEIDVAKMTIGMEARIDVDALPKKQFTGRVTKIAPASDSTTAATGAATSGDAVVKYPVEITITDADEALKSGMTAKCTVEVIKHDNVLTVPTEYVGREDGKRFVMLAPSNPKAKPEKKYVDVGAETGAKVEILGGVSEGAKIVKPAFNGPPRKGAMQFGPDE